MFDDFIIRAFAAGIGLALITGPLGCFIIWRRLSYFGDTIAHSALLGVVIAYAMNFNLIIAVFAVSCFIALSLLFLQKKTNLPIASVRAFLEISVVSIGWYLGGTVGVGTVLFAFGIGPCVAFGLFIVDKISTKK